ncbi:P-loop containing nucleoside triphosphate hydrolase protein [Umbelopsis sp. PMI_123]|nr:P-loop containing nucleoside triphosphate hydrolase protein [Umbelopsis sp. PMI_123]
MNDPYRTQSPYGGANRTHSPPSYQSSPQRTQQTVMKVGQCPNPDAALSNFLFVAPGQFDPKEHYLLVNDQYVFTMVADETLPRGIIGTNLMHRRWAQFSLKQDVHVRPYDPFEGGYDIYLSAIQVEVGFFKKSSQVDTEMNADDMAQVFSNLFKNQIFSFGQLIAFEFNGVTLACRVTGLDVVELSALKKGFRGEVDAKNDEFQSAAERGVLVAQTTIQFNRDPESPIRIKDNKRLARAKPLIRTDFKFEDMGIGGLDAEFNAIFRRAFASRIFPPAIIDKLGIQHVKGIVLYGPPGTGKTLMARQIGKMLNAREPKIVSGPEILSKMVGESEANVRKLFTDAEKEFKEKGEESSLHIIICDEMDAICKQRGSRNDGTGVGDSIVNQFLAKMDGVEQLNNVLIIGMTNRLDMLDDALLRPGRFEVHMEIGLPDDAGREQIWKIHTAKMRENNILDHGVHLDEMASMTKNYTGAEIAGVVKAASSYAFTRHIKLGSVAGVAPDVENMTIQLEDIKAALEEVPPAFGVSENELQQCVQNHVLNFDEGITSILTDGNLFVEQVRNSTRTQVVSVLLHGAANSGKTALAATIAMKSQFPFIKLISPEAMIGFTESSKINHINKIFNDAYKSPLSVIVLDNIERIMDWVDIGPRFSNNVLQALLVLLKRKPPKDRRLLIIATTSQREMLSSMHLDDAFDSEFQVPLITRVDTVGFILEQLNIFTDEERELTLQRLHSKKLDDRFEIGIKKLLMNLEVASQSSNKVDKFVQTIYAARVSIRYTENTSGARYT